MNDSITPIDVIKLTPEERELRITEYMKHMPLAAAAVEETNLSHAMTYTCGGFLLIDVLREPTIPGQLVWGLASRLMSVIDSLTTTYKGSANTDDRRQLLAFVTFSIATLGLLLVDTKNSEKLFEKHFKGVPTTYGEWAEHVGLHCAASDAILQVVAFADTEVPKDEVH